MKSRAPTLLVVRSLTFGMVTVSASVALFVGACVMGGAGGGEVVFFVVGAATMAAVGYAETLREERGRLPGSPTPLALTFVAATRTSRLLRKAVATFALQLVSVTLVGVLVAFLMRVLADGSAVGGFVLVTAMGAGFGLGQAAFAIWLRRWEMRHDLTVYEQAPGGPLFAVRASTARDIR